MSLEHQQNLLAKLYTDAEFRRAFLSEPDRIGAQNNLTASEIGEIASVMPDELNFFAESLFWKRLRETEKFLPLTRRALGADFAERFREFSREFNPQSVKKHFEDALGFCRFLQKRDISNFAKNAARFERSKHEFFGFEKRLVVCRLEYDLRSFIAAGAEQPFEMPPAKKKIAVWLRIGQRFRHFFI